MEQSTLDKAKKLEAEIQAAEKRLSGLKPQKEFHSGYENKLRFKYHEIIITIAYTNNDRGYPSSVEEEKRITISPEMAEYLYRTQLNLSQAKLHHLKTKLELL